MSDPLIVNQVFLWTAAVVMFAGCDASAPQSDAAKKQVGRENVTFYVAGMNQRLKIL